MASLLASPSFLTGAKDSLATADVYTLSTDTPINSIQAITTASDPTIANSLRGGKAVAATAASLLSAAIPAVNSDIASLTKRLSLSSPSMALTLNSLSSSAVSSILGNITSNSGISGLLNGITSTITGAIGDISAIGSLISGNSCGDSFSISDPKALAGATSGYLKIAMSSGIKGAFSALTCGISNPSILNNIISDVLPSVISNSDIGSLQSMASFPGGSGMVLSMSPDILSSVSASYTNPIGTTASDLLTNSSAITDAFSAVDPTWDSSVRTTTAGFSTLMDVTSIQGASSDFQDTMSCAALSAPPVLPSTDFSLPTPAPTIQQLSLVTPSYPPTTVNQQLDDDFSDTVTTSPPVNTSGSTTPSSTSNQPIVTTIPSTTTTFSETTVNGNSSRTVSTTSTGGGSTLTTYPTEEYVPLAESPPPKKGFFDAAIADVTTNP